ncbi:MAG: beta-N-acetylhexosaminidase, partial [Gemmatimonadetes bacterium]|nr:beta-N-acetylhexosaminidase [Gemmatimonadota bacterium]
MRDRPRGTPRLRRLLPLLCLFAAACGAATRSPRLRPMPPEHALIPVPASVELDRGRSFTLTLDTRVVVEPGSPEVARIGGYLAGILRPSTGFPLPVSTE